MRTTGILLAFSLSLAAVPASARAEAPRVVSAPDSTIRELPGTEGRWLEGHTIVPVSPETVRSWFTDFERWPQIFRDYTHSRVLGHDGSNTFVWLRSVIMDGEIVIEVVDADGVLSWKSKDRNIDNEGKVFLRALEDGSTDVVMQTTARVKGFLGAFVPRRLIRDREWSKLNADMSDLHRLAALHRREAQR